MKTLIRLLAGFSLLLLIVWFLVTQPILFKPVLTTTPEVSAGILESHVRTLSEVLPRRSGNQTSLEPTVYWIEEQLKPYGNSYRQSYKVEEETFHNIFIDFGPMVKHPSKDIIIIGAHYDTAHGFPGADDNASAVAALIELAKLLSKDQDKLGSRVQLAFYSLEEPPYFRTEAMGSFVHASHLKQTGENVRLMIALDMIGYFSDEENSQHFPFPLMDKVYSDKGNFIAIVGNLTNISSVRKVKKGFLSGTKLPVYSINSPAFITGIDFSDHLNFWHYGFPAVMITDTSFNRNIHYHTEQDTAEKLDYEKMAEVLKGIYQTVLTISNQK